MLLVVMVEVVCVVTLLNFQDFYMSSVLPFHFIHNCESMLVFVSILGLNMSLINPLVTFHIVLNPEFGYMRLIKFTVDLIFVENVF